MYEKYEQRMKRIAAAIHRFRFVILAAVAALLTAVIVLLGVGVAFSGLTCKSIIYGERVKPFVSSSAIRVTYYYRPVESTKESDWTERTPREPGDYEVKAVGTSLFGYTRTLATTEFSIEKKFLEFTQKEVEIYGEPENYKGALTDIIIEGLELEDFLCNATFDIYEDNGRWVYDARDFRFRHIDGTDATDCYRLNYNGSTATVKDIRAELTVAAGSKTHKYNGNPSERVFSDEVKIIKGALKEGHTLTARCVGEISGIGTAANVIDPESVSIVDENGEDVSWMYKLTFAEGTLTFAPRSITIVSDSAEKDYDGLPLSKNGFTIRGDGLAEGDRLDASCYSVLVDPGIINNDYTEPYIISEAYGDVTYCYKIIKQYGKLKVNYPEDGEIQGSDENEFNLDHGNDGNMGSGFGMLVEAPRTKVFGFRGQSNRRYYFREHTYEYYDGHSWKNLSIDSDIEYQMHYLTGTLLRDEGYQRDRVLVRKLRLNHHIFPYFMAEDEKDATENYYDYACETYLTQSWETSYPSRIDDRYLDYVYAHYTDVPEDVRTLLLDLGTAAGIREGDANIIDRIAKYIQGAASYDMNYPKFPDDQDMVTYFLTVSKRGICQHYASAGVLMYRAYGIPARFTVGMVGEGKANQWVDVYTDEGHAWVEVYLPGTGWIPVEVTGGPADSEGLPSGMVDGGFVIDDGGSGGGGSPERLDLYIEFAPYTKEYDGRPATITDPAWYISYGELAEGDRIVVTPVTIDAAPEVGIYEEYVYIYILDEYGNEVTWDYNFGYSYPSIEVTRRTIEIATYGSVGSEGDTASSVSWFVSKGTLANGDWLDVTMTAKQDAAGKKQNWPTSVKVYNREGEDVTGMYNIKYDPGVLEIINGEKASNAGK